LCVPAAFADSPEFQRLLAGEAEPDLVRIALEIAKDVYRDLDPEAYLTVIEMLAARVRDRCPTGAKAQHVLGQINWVLFVEEGFRGNTDDYYDPKNSYLNEVIDRKVGIPITLSLLYWKLAEKLGLSLEPLNLPAHFLLRVGDSDPTIFVDPFNSGTLLDRQGCERRISELLGRPFQLTALDMVPCGHDVVVSRMLRNLKAIYLSSHEYQSALPVQRRLAALARDDPEEQRDLGTLCLRLDRPMDAIAPLEAYLDACPDNDDAEPVRSLLRAARREMASRN
jgi:regulator of sirC expression with transglutaminase-like and TPR domain